MKFRDAVKKGLKHGVLAGLITSGLLFFGIASAKAANSMPDFDGAPAGWITDRYQPDFFGDIGPFQGRDNVLQIGIDSSDGFGSRPAGFNSTFYNTQGMQHGVVGGAGDSIAAELFIPMAWGDEGNGTIRTDMWAVMTDGASVTDYPIIGFTNYGGPARYRLWDDVAWVDLGAAVLYDDWTEFEIAFTGVSHQFFINDVLVYTDLTINGSTGFDAVIMQAYNFFGDPSLGAVVPVNYEVHWDNEVPEPAALALFAFGLVGLGAARLRRRVTV